MKHVRVVTYCFLLLFAGYARAEHALQTLLPALVLGQVAAPSDDKTWIKTYLGGVYKSTDTDFMTAQEKLLHSLDLLDGAETNAILDRINKNIVKGNEVKAIPKSNLPVGLAERVLAAFKKLHEKGLVVVEIGTTSEIGQFDSRHGVMTREEYEKIFGKGGGSDLVGHSCEIDHGGEKIRIDCDYKDALDYVAFGCKYDEKTKTWVNKYAPKSNELAVVNATQEAIVSIYDKDINFKGAPEIRSHIAESMFLIVANNPNPPDQFHQVVRREVVLFNLRSFHRTYKQDLKAKRLLSDNPTDEDLLNFAAVNEKLFLMGHYKNDKK